MNTPHNPYQAPLINTAYAATEIEVELASPWARIAAYILNSLLTVLVFVPMFVSFIFRPTDIDLEDPAFILHIASGPGMIISLLLALILLLWQLTWMSTRGQSVAKRLLRIKVIKLNGENPGFIGNVLMREVVFQLIILVLVFILGLLVGLLVGSAFLEEYGALFDLLSYIPTFICLIMLFNPNTMRRTLQDYLAQTIVIKA